MPRTDPAHEAAEERLAELERRIAREYGRALEDVRGRMAGFLARFERQDRAYRKRVEGGSATEAQYRAWRRDQVMDSDRFRALVRKLSEDLTRVAGSAMGIVNGELPELYAEGMNYGTFEVERGTTVETAFTLYDRSTVTALIRDQPDLYPTASVNRARQEAWDRRHLTSVVTQGLLTGAPMDRIAASMERVVGMDASVAARAARTCVTAAENSGRVDSYRRAERLGIKVRKQWLATLDGRTRSSHRELDGESVGVEDTFSNGLMYPGDPSGAGRERYNCRCTLVADLTDFPSEQVSRASKLGDMTYEQWRAEHVERTIPAGVEGAGTPPMLSGFRGHVSDFLLEHDQEIDLSPVEREELRDMVGRMFDQSDVYSFIGAEAVRDMAGGGHLKNAFELHEDAGDRDTPRGRVTEYLFGKDSSDMPARQFEKYGFMGSRDVDRVLSRGGVASSYGGVCVRYRKSNLADRMTYTFGDSLNEMQEGTVMTAGGLGDGLSITGIPVADMKRCYRRMKSLEKKTGVLDASDVTEKCVGKKWYIEAQLHGDVTMDDVSEVMVKYRWDGKRYVPDDDSLTDGDVTALEESLSDRGITVRRYSVRPDVDEETGKMVSKVVWIGDTDSVEG